MNIKNFQIITTILITGFSISILGLSSCSKSSGSLGSDCTSDIWILESQDELDAWMTATRRYEDEPTRANCENEKQVISDFIRSLEEYRDCTPALFKPYVDHNIKKAKNG